jgi:hypothetical protein
MTVGPAKITTQMPITVTNHQRKYAHPILRMFLEVAMVQEKHKTYRSRFFCCSVVSLNFGERGAVPKIVLSNFATVVSNDEAPSETEFALAEAKARECWC